MSVLVCVCLCTQTCAAVPASTSQGLNAPSALGLRDLGIFTLGITHGIFTHDAPLALQRLGLGFRGLGILLHPSRLVATGLRQSRRHGLSASAFQSLARLGKRLGSRLMHPWQTLDAPTRHPGCTCGTPAIGTGLSLALPLFFPVLSFLMPPLPAWSH